ncbi:hypothetical protein HMPREF0083_04799 [Aneurinibacillus aneurinilyticus ATCC 12856]|uniref:Uncharacterized protein n=1 Tax=Aneurinibacillus aneurinilyticus ATCC 12856 TaxID=649747 RepID=U1Y8I4_ANEAE|nr:hypothetical protein HMPREF0083_04799 [Aneurinibacillus aneurinilyticus ATCC 12856]
MEEVLGDEACYRIHSVKKKKKRRWYTLTIIYRHTVNKSACRTQPLWQ